MYAPAMLLQGFGAEALELIIVYEKNGKQKVSNQFKLIPRRMTRKPKISPQTFSDITYIFDGREDQETVPDVSSINFLDIPYLRISKMLTIR